MRKGYLPGLILILLGVFLLLNQLFPLPGSLFMVFVGAGLLAARFVTGMIGFSIAGSIALCLGLSGVISEIGLLSDDLESAAQLLLLAMGFFLMHIIDYRRIGNWPLIPGLCLVGVAVLVFMDGNINLARNLRGIVRQFWPVALICAGAATLSGVYSSRKREREKNPGPHANGETNQQEDGEQK